MVSSLFNNRGLPELERDLHRLDGVVAEEIKRADQDVAQEAARRARSRAGGLGGVHAHVAPGITADGNSVGLDGGAYPMIFGAEFGANRYPQFPPYTSDGYMAGPAADEVEQETTRYDQALETALRKVDL